MISQGRLFLAWLVGWLFVGSLVRLLFCGSPAFVRLSSFPPQKKSTLANPARSVCALPCAAGFANFASKTEEDVGDVVQNLSKTTLEVYNYFVQVSVARACVCVCVCMRGESFLVWMWIWWFPAKEVFVALDRS